jgi:hypothetical protein
MASQLGVTFPSRTLFKREVMNRVNERANAVVDACLFSTGLIQVPLGPVPSLLKEVFGSVDHGINVHLEPQVYRHLESIVILTDLSEAFPNRLLIFGCELIEGFANEVAKASYFLRRALTYSMQALQVQFQAKRLKRNGLIVVIVAADQGGAPPIECCVYKQVKRRQVRPGHW